jgi:hypothetical protein
MGPLMPGLPWSGTLTPLYFSILCNIHSLTSKYDNLRQIVLSFINNKINVPVIAVQEIWQLPHPETVNIPGYKFTFKQCTQKKGGGIGFYILQNIPFKTLIEFSPFIEKCFETLTVEITLNGKRTNLTNIYRSPSH